MLGSRDTRGFIALMSAIIISAALMTLALSGSLFAFYTRLTALDAELKEHSAALADACASEALLELAIDTRSPGDATTSIGDDACYTSQVFLGGTHATFEVRGIYQNATTNLQVTFDTQNLTVLSWQEIPTFLF